MRLESLLCLPSKNLFTNAAEAKNLIMQEQIMLQVFLANRNTQETRA
jgi:hypothetical protein